MDNDQVQQYLHIESIQHPYAEVLQPSFIPTHETKNGLLAVRMGVDVPSRARQCTTRVICSHVVGCLVWFVGFFAKTVLTAGI